MKNNYDVAVIGAGNGGLLAAVTCAKRGLKTILFEQHNIPGGFATSFKRGRFEFDPSLHELGNVGDKSNQGKIYKIFEELGIKVDWVEIPEAFHLVVNENEEKYDYVLPFGVEEFCKKCDEYEPGSYQKVKDFLDVCKNCYEAVGYIYETRGNPDIKVLKEKYANYVTTASYSLDEVLTSMKIPKISKYILESYWIYLGLSPKELCCQLYCVMLYEYIQFKAYIPKNRSHEISSAIASRFEELGGKIYYNTKVNKINVNNNKVESIETSNGSFKVNNIISNVSPHIVFGSLIDDDKVPSFDKQISNWREPGVQGFCIYLGLDVPIEKLNLHDYSYYMFNGFDHDLVYKNMSNIETNDAYLVLAINNADKTMSEKNTSIVTFTTLYNDAWKDINEENYFTKKEEIANRFIEDFEKKMNISLKPHIEEIEIASPVTFARYTSAVNGAIYSYPPRVTDSSFIRNRNLKYFELIDGLVFCGANSSFTHGYSITYVSGYIAANRTYANIKNRGK